MYIYAQMNETVFKAMTIAALKNELADLEDIGKGKVSLFYGTFNKKYGRFPTDQEIQFEIERVKKSLKEEQVNEI